MQPMTLICAFVFAYAISGYSHDTAHMLQHLFKLKVKGDYRMLWVFTFLGLLQPLHYANMLPMHMQIFLNDVKIIIFSSKCLICFLFLL